MKPALFGIQLTLCWVMVALCGLAGETLADSGQTVREGVRGGPLEIHPPGSRYFRNGEGPVYLTGSHTWLGLQQREGEPVLTFEQLLQLLLEYRHNVTKIWMQEDMNHSPLPYLRARTEPTSDATPKFDLTRWNDRYFQELRSRALTAQAHGIYLVIMLFNGWSVEGKLTPRTVWYRHPFHRDNNVNGIDGDLNQDGEGREVHTLSNPGITTIQEAYVRKVIDTLNDLDNVLYEIANECTASPENTAWQYHMINYIHAYEKTKPKQHPVGMTVQWPNGSNKVLFESPADWISPNVDNGYQTDPPSADVGKVILNDTDHLWGNGGSAEWVWKSFTRGLNPIFMDVTPPLSNQFVLTHAEEVRQALGDTLEYAERMDLERTKPRPELCSTTFCLVNPGREYLVYLPPTSWCAVPFVGRLYKCRLTIDLADGASALSGEWFDPNTRTRVPLSPVRGGATQSFVPPFDNGSVLHLKAL